MKQMKQMKLCNACISRGERDGELDEYIYCSIREQEICDWCRMPVVKRYR